MQRTGLAHTTPPIKNLDEYSVNTNLPEQPSKKELKIPFPGAFPSSLWIQRPLCCSCQKSLHDLKAEIPLHFHNLQAASRDFDRQFPLIFLQKSLLSIAHPGLQSAFPLFTVSFPPGTFPLAFSISFLSLTPDN